METSDNFRGEPAKGGKFGPEILTIVRPWPNVKPSEKRSFLTLTQFCDAKTQFSGRMDVTFDLCCSSALESNAPFKFGTKY
jgi:hypothetical protein